MSDCSWSENDEFELTSVGHIRGDVAICVWKGYEAVTVEPLDVIINDAPDAVAAYINTVKPVTYKILEANQVSFFIFFLFFFFFFFFFF